MRLHVCMLLAACALGAGAVPSRADEGFCPMGTADNWQPLTPETAVPEMLQVEISNGNPTACLQHTTVMMCPSSCCASQ